MIQVYHNNRCGKSREAIKLLEEAGVEFEIIKYLETPPTNGELTELLTKLEISAIDLVRKKEKIWIENYKGKNLSNDEIVEAMIQNPILIERPIIIIDNKAIIARPPEKLNNFI